MFGSANSGKTSSVGTRWSTPILNNLALPSERSLLPLEDGESKPPIPVVPGIVIGTGAVISILFCINFSIHDICMKNRKIHFYLQKDIDHTEL